MFSSFFPGSNNLKFREEKKISIISKEFALNQLSTSSNKISQTGLKLES